MTTDRFLSMFSRCSIGQPGDEPKTTFAERATALYTQVLNMLQSPYKYHREPTGRSYRLDLTKEEANFLLNVIFALTNDDGELDTLIDPDKMMMSWNKMPPREVQQPEYTHMQVANAIRMLMRDDINHEPMCTLARDRIVYLLDQEQRLASRLKFEIHKNRRLEEYINSLPNKGEQVA